MRSVDLPGRVVAVVALLLLVGPGFAQLQSGDLSGTVADEKGAALPGVTVTLTGEGAPQVQVTNAQGQFRFLGLPPESYKLKAELESFATVEYPSITINVGRNTEITVTMSAVPEEEVLAVVEPGRALSLERAITGEGGPSTA